MSATISRRVFARWLVAISLVGLVVRIAYVVIRRDHPIGGDPFFYHEGANLLADGGGFVQPFLRYFDVTVEAADHPPLYLLYLTIPSLVGLDTPLAHMTWSALLGTGTVFLTGLLGREVAGERVGLVAAGLAALYPNLWSWDAMILSETLATFLATLSILLAYRAWMRPSFGRVIALGAACGGAALARSELLLLLPALLAPVVLLAREVELRERLRRLGAGTLVAVALMAPWVGYNLIRFEHPVFLSSQFEPTVAGANCRDTYSGFSLGFITNTCLYGIDQEVDQSVNARTLRDRASRFVRDNLDRVPVVVAARVGRITGLFRPGQQIDFEELYEGRDRGVAVAGMLSFYVVAAMAMAGAISLARLRAVPMFPLLVMPAIVLVTVVLTYGSTRFRASAETSLVVLAAVALDRLWSRVRSPAEPTHSAG